MTCAEQLPTTPPPLNVTTTPILMLLAGIALGWLVTMAASMPEVAGPEDWHGNVRVSQPAP